MDLGIIPSYSISGRHLDIAKEAFFARKEGLPVHLSFYANLCHADDGSGVAPQLLQAIVVPLCLSEYVYYDSSII